MPEDEKKPEAQDPGQADSADKPSLKDEDLFDGPVPSPDAESDPSSLFVSSGSGKSGAVSAGNADMAIRKHLRLMQMILIVCIVLMVAMVGYMFFYQARKFQANANVPVFVQAENKGLPSATLSEEESETELLDEKPANSEEPISLFTAKQYYQQGDFKKSLYVYKKLRRNLNISEDKSMADYLLLCMAVCNLKNNNTEGAIKDLVICTDSEFNFVRICGNYYLCKVELERKQYDLARLRAYQVLGLIDSMSSDEKLAALKGDCEYFAATALTLSLTGLSDADKTFPVNVFQFNLNSYDPILDFDESQLAVVLSDQQHRFQAGILAPSIELKSAEKTDSSEKGLSKLSVCSVISYGSSIEELMSRFATKFSLELHWNVTNDIQNIRHKSVRLYMAQTTAEEFIQVATGCSGLTAQFDGNTVEIYNPSEYQVLSEHLGMLFGQAAQSWQKFIITYFEDKRLCDAHFAMAALYAGRNNIPQAIDEYKLISSKYSQSRLAPYALYQSSMLKISLKDFTGTRQDLLELVEQYPDCAIADKAYMLLADITSIQGDKLKAARLFTKVYNLNYSQDSQQSAAVNAAKTFYEAGDYESASNWIAKYINDLDGGDKNSLYKAYLLTGKIYLGWNKFDKACSALKFALQGQLTKQEYKDTVFALVSGYIEKENYIEALDVLQNVNSWQFSEQEFIKLLITRSSIYRKLGLYNKAIAILADKAEYITVPELKHEMLYEISLNKISLGNFDSAYDTLTQIIMSCEAGNFNDKVSLTLADVCIRLNRNKQAYDLCSGLLAKSCDEDIKLQAQQLVSEVYCKENNFDGAALALLGFSNKTD